MISYCLLNRLKYFSTGRLLCEVKLSSTNSSFTFRRTLAIIMDFIRQIKFQFQHLEQRQLIDIQSLKLWITLLIVSFGCISWLWDHLVVEKDPMSHYPPSLLPPDVRKKLPAHGFTNEQDARAFAIKEMEIAVIACRGDKDESDESAMDAIIMMKSAALLSKSVIHFHIYTEDILYPSFMKELDKWPSFVRHRVSFQFGHVTYPESLLGWKNYHRPCSSFKLFLPNVLKEFDFAMYVDSDTVFLNSVDSLWSSLTQFSESHMIALAATEATSEGPLSKFGIKSLDTRAIVFDIYRLRHSVFEIPFAYEGGRFSLRNMTYNPSMLQSLYQLFHDEITVPDQDLLSILYHFNKDKFFLQQCEWAFRWKYCEHYLSWVKDRFLNATLKKWPLHKSKICPHTFMLHKHQSYVSPVGENQEFSDMQKHWESADYVDSKFHILREIGKTSRNCFFNQICHRLNMDLFQKSMSVSMKGA